MVSDTDSNTPKQGILVYHVDMRSPEMARTNIELDDVLVERAMRLTGATTKKKVVDIALRRLVEKGSLYRSMRRLKGELEWVGDVSASRSSRPSRE